MRKSAILALGAVLVAGSALASNTGFKLNYPLLYQAGRTNTNWMAFPTYYYPDGNTLSTVETSVGLCSDLNDFVVSSPPPKVANVIKWQPTLMSPLTQSCTSTKVLFNLTPGEGYAAVPVGSNVVVNVVGSNNDLTAPNKAGGAPFYPLLYQAGRTNTNWFSVPYHSLADNAVDLCTMWNAQTSNQVGSVVKWQPTLMSPLTQSCTSTKVLFTLTPGEAYAVVPRTTGQLIGTDVY